MIKIFYFQMYSCMFGVCKFIHTTCASGRNFSVVNDNRNSPRNRHLFVINVSPLLAR